MKQYDWMMLDGQPHFKNNGLCWTCVVTQQFQKVCWGCVPPMRTCYTWDLRRVHAGRRRVKTSGVGRSNDTEMVGKCWPKSCEIQVVVVLCCLLWNGLVTVGEHRNARRWWIWVMYMVEWLWISYTTLTQRDLRFKHYQAFVDAERHH